MAPMFRSEEMVLCQLFIQAEAAYSCLCELGELGILEIKDLNSEVNAFQRKFVHEIRRCDEMERKLNFFEAEINKEKLPILDTDEFFPAPGLKEEWQLEDKLEKLQDEIIEVNKSIVELKKNQLELAELRQVLKKMSDFFDVPVESRRPSIAVAAARRLSVVPGPRARRFSHASVINEAKTSFLNDSDRDRAESRFQDLEYVTGVITRERLMGFETMLWRVTRGNIFVRHEAIDEQLEDPETGAVLNKVVFIAFYQGEHLKSRIEKICQGYRSNLYPMPHSESERRELSASVSNRLDDVETVLQNTVEHKQKLLAASAKNLRCWQTKIGKVKAVYYQLNKFNINLTHMTLIGEAWCPVEDMARAQAALNKGTDTSGSTIPSIINTLATNETPPTYFKTNRFTEGFQAIVNAYGIANYREMNPTPYTIITFPFLFAVMFGDAGHGFIMALFAAYLVLKEKTLRKQAANSEIFGMFFGGRYIILLMGLFSIYTGFLYNDVFSKGMNIFGSSWTAFHGHLEQGHHAVDLDPQKFYTKRKPYWFGIDPVWMVSENKILFLNSYKMKLSVILGVGQMMLGVVLSAVNHRYFRKPINIYCEFIPQVIFLVVIFGYMDLLIIYKWFKFDAANSFCAPSILITLINMFMLKYPTEPCNAAEMYRGQKVVQMLFLLLAVVCIPWMLVVKPLLIKRQRESKHQHRASYRSSKLKKIRTASQMPVKDAIDAEEAIDEGVSLELNNVNDSGDPADRAGGSKESASKRSSKVIEEEEESMGDVVIHQIIHTIEYCLGSISHTASYLRLWALSLAHAQLSEVLWGMVMRIGLNASAGVGGAVLLYVIFAAWASLTVAILLLMEGLSAFLHALRLHWVEFQSKFYSGSGRQFEPFDFQQLPLQADESSG